MLTSDELEAAALGARWVQSRGDPALSRAAADLIAKLAAIVPEKLRDVALDPVSRTGPAWEPTEDRIDLAKVRGWIHEGKKIALGYNDEQGRATERITWPVAVGYFDSVRHLIAWCELRRDFRSFRTDRIASATFLEERYPERPSVLRARWRKTIKEN
jgi:predicted DNA-binding transcriptional regulator YafY